MGEIPHQYIDEMLNPSDVHSQIDELQRGTTFAPTGVSPKISPHDHLTTFHRTPADCPCQETIVIDISPQEWMARSPASLRGVRAARRSRRRKIMGGLSDRSG